MLSYCLKCRKNTESKNPKLVKIKNGKIKLFSKWEVCHSKQSKLIKEQKDSELIGSLGIKTPFSKILLVGPLLF